MRRKRLTELLGKFFNPAVALMNRLRYPQKFILISLLFAVPLGLVLGQFISEVEGKKSFSQKELDGTAYLRPARAVLESGLEQRQASASYLSGATDEQTELLEISRTLDERLADLGAVEERLGSELDTTEEYEAVLSSWSALSEATLDQGLSDADPKEIDALHQRFIADVRALISRAGDTSNLILDPDLDSFYLMDTVVLKGPEMAELLADAELISRELSESADPTGTRRAELLATAGVIESTLRENERGMAVSFENNPAGNVEPAVGDLLDEYSRAVEDFLEGIQAQGSVASTGPADLGDRADEASDATFAFWDGSVEELDFLLERRVDGFNDEERLIIILTALALALVLYLWVGFYRSVMRTVSTLDAAAERMREGDLGEPIELKAKDELGDVAASFNTVAAALAKAEEERAKAQEEHARFQEETIRRQAEAIDALSTPAIPVHDEILVLPLVGELDERRIANVRAALVEGLHETGAKVAIVDVTGVPMFDDAVAVGLIQAAAAARLLGCQAVLTGMRPEMAARLAQLDLQLDGLVTEASLQRGIEFATTYIREDRVANVQRSSPSEK